MNAQTYVWAFSIIGVVICNLLFLGSRNIENQAGDKMRPPEIAASTQEERRQYIKQTYPCIADCDMCGICTVFRGKDPELAYEDYIQGRREYIEVSADYR